MPTQTLNGKVSFVNNAPASGVRVRVFDRDTGSADEDLTLSEGLSNAGGDFTVQFDPGRFQDSVQSTKPVWEMTSPPTLSKPSGTWGWVNHTVSGPDLSDIYSPYLRFSYTINGQARVQTATLQPLQTQFTLPDAPAPSTTFQPSVHGFQFLNNFPGYPLPFTVPQLPSLPSVPPEYGLCGGMSTAAADFFWANRPIPATTTPPAQGTPFHQYLYQRQMDTFEGGAKVRKFAEWMALPDGTPLGTQRRTADEFALLRAQLHAGRLVVLGLVYVDLQAPIWHNHQVLALACQTTSSQTFRIHVYDPNFPTDDSIFIEAQLVTVGSRVVAGPPPSIQTLTGLQCSQNIPDLANPGQRALRTVRGFFLMPYQAVTPPAGL